MTKKDQEHFTKVFDECMTAMSGVYNREFSHPAVRAYFQACERWSEGKMRDAFRKAIESEKFCPTVATLRAYGASVREEHAPAVEPTGKRPQYTPEQIADLDKWKKNFVDSFVPPPWATEQGRRPR